MLLVDTYNVLYAGAVLPRDLAGLELQDLADLLATSRYGAEPTTLVCDGKRPRPDSGSAVRSEKVRSIIVLYSGASKSADDLIEELIARSTAPRRLKVVSSDRRIQAAARRRRALVLGSEAFLRQLGADRDRFSRKPKPIVGEEVPLSAASIALWMREFGFEADEDRIRRAAGSRDRETRKARRPAADSAELPPPVSPGPARGPTPIDADLARLIEQWGSGIDLDDLEMSKWLDREPS